MTDLGFYALVIALAVAAYAAVASALGARTGRRELVASAENAVWVSCGLVSISVIALIYALVTRDFSLEYVANYTSRGLSMTYTFSAWWAGNDGSMLLWVWLLALFASIAVRQNKRQNRELIPYVISILMATGVFFLFLLIFLANPFRKLSFTPPDGRGLNPMLENPGMFFHPPTTYLGYVGVAVPFAFAMAALITKRLDDVWIRSTRKWTIFAWFFLSVGNMVGAWWAYYTLGWGGHWGWDPVENASFMPWLVMSAYLHSVMIQEKKDMLKIWNMVLIILTFTLTIMGTFITRSGVIQSVHTFAQSALGPFFLGFIGITLALCFVLLASRLDLLKSKNELDSLLSRESTFLFNNLILVGIAFTVLWGTTFPFISEAVRGVKVTVAAPFYNQVSVPLGLVLLLLMGICPLIAWRKASGRNLRKNFLYPSIIALIGGGALYANGIGHILALITLTLCIFVTSVIVIEFIQGTRIRRRTTKESYQKAFLNLIWKNKRRYGGYVIHFGLVLIFLATVGEAFKTEKIVTLEKGQAVQLKEYTIRYDNMLDYPTPTKHVVATVLSVFNQDKKLGTVTARKEFYKTQEQPWTRVAVFSNMKEDLYVILSGWDETGKATFKILVNPLMMWLWVGGYIIAFGTIIVMWPDKRERERLAARYAREMI